MLRNLSELTAGLEKLRDYPELESWVEEHADFELPVLSTGGPNDPEDDAIVDLLLEVEEALPEFALVDDCAIHGPSAKQLLNKGFQVQTLPSGSFFKYVLKAEKFCIPF